MSNGQPFTECEFEVSPIETDLTGSISAKVYEVGGDDPTTIIGTDQAWYAVIEWQVKGGVVPHLCGDWRVAINLESIGPGTEYQFRARPVPMDPCEHPDGKYSTRIDVAAGEVDVDVDGTLYQVGVTLASRDACGKPGHIAAHCSGAHLHFYQQPPHTGP